MSDCIRAYDWSRSPLGQTHTWSPTLRAAVRFMLPSRTQTVMFWGPEFVALYNDAYAPTIGNKHPHALGRPAREYWAELWEDLEPMLLRVRGGETVSAKDRPFQIERDGYLEQVFFDICYFPAFNDDGHVEGVVCHVAETTDRIRSLDAVRVANERIELALNAGAVIGTWVWDIVNDRMTADKRFAAAFSLDEVEAQRGLRFADVARAIHPDDAGRVTALVASAVKNGGPYRAEYRVRNARGTYVWVEANGHCELDENGAATRFPGVLIDIAERKKAEAATRAADARQSFMLTLIDLMRGSDTEAAMNQVCALMGSYFGVTRVGYGLLDPVEDVFTYTVCWHDERVPPLLGRLPAAAFGVKIVAKLTAGETVVVGDLMSDPLSDEAETRKTASSVETRAILVVPFVRAGRLRMIVYLNDRVVRQWTREEIRFMQDVADRTRQFIEKGEAEEALRLLNANLEREVQQRTQALRAAEDALHQSQKMEAVGQLTGGLAHDFNNLLAGITGSLELIQRRITQGKITDIDRFIDAAQEAAKRAAALTHRLLAFSRRQTLDPKPINLTHLIADILELVERSVGPGVTIEVVAGHDTWPTMVDPNQVENALLNLCLNARDAMPDGGQIIIETWNTRVAEAEAKALDLAAGEYVVLAVRDTGIGMPANVVERAFEPFFTTKPLGKGTGLGLSMIYGFARQSGGQVRISSVVDAGTSVNLYLPRCDRRTERAPDISAQGAAVAKGAGEHVLVVDDEMTIRLFMKEMLTESGYLVSEAYDGPSGLAAVQSSKPFDLLITDVGLPGGVNGRQIADAARARRPGLKIIFITGYAESAVMGKGGLDHGMHVITKPFEMDALVAKVRELLQR